MGLDITSYKNLTPFSGKFNSDHEPLADETTGEPLEYGTYLQVNANPNFVGRAEGLKNGEFYLAEESAHFRAGSYSGYNDWREILAKVAGYPAVGSGNDRVHSEGAWLAHGGPFHELINFSDCEGDIGPVVSAKLAKDFADFQQKADEIEDWEGRWRDLYGQWREAFERAAQNGCVSFH